MENPDAPVTRFTALNVVPAENNIIRGDFFSFPQLTEEEIRSIPEENLEPGIVVYNTTQNVYMAYFINGEHPEHNGWANLNTSLTWTGAGYEAGAPFAFPIGPRSLIESNPANYNPGTVYVDTENGDIPRIYIPGLGWEDVAAGGESGDFTNLHVSTSSSFDGTFSVNSTTASFGHDVNVTGIVTTANLSAPAASITTLSGGLGDFVTVAADNANFSTSVDINGDIIAIGYSIFNRIQMEGPLGGTSGADFAAPITSVLGAGAGTGASMTIAGSGLGGTMTLVAGTGTITNATIATFTLYNGSVSFYRLFTAPYGISITPASSSSAPLSGIYVSITQLSDGLTQPAAFTLSIAGDTLVTGVTYIWNYIIIGNNYAP